MPIPSGPLRPCRADDHHRTQTAARLPCGAGPPPAGNEDSPRRRANKTCSPIRATGVERSACVEPPQASNSNCEHDRLLPRRVTDERAGPRIDLGAAQPTRPSVASEHRGEGWIVSVEPYFVCQAYHRCAISSRCEAQYPRLALIWEAPCRSGSVFTTVGSINPSESRFVGAYPVPLAMAA